MRMQESVRTADGEWDVVKLDDRDGTVSDATDVTCAMTAEVFWQSRLTLRRWHKHARQPAIDYAACSPAAPTRERHPPATLYCPHS
jgi:hypothetical protein